jgi:hypothetical protein
MGSLPQTLQRLGADQAVLRKEGLYLRVRHRFVEADHVLIRSKEEFPVMLTSGDPSFTELRPRIWLVRIKG